MFLSGPGSRAVVQAQPSSQSTDFGLHAQRGPCCVLPALFGAQDLWSCLTRIWKMNTERGEQRSEQVGQPPPPPESCLQLRSRCTSFSEPHSPQRSVNLCAPCAVGPACFQAGLSGAARRGLPHTLRPGALRAFAVR